MQLNQKIKVEIDSPRMIKILTDIYGELADLGAERIEESDGTVCVVCKKPLPSALKKKIKEYTPHILALENRMCMNLAQKAIDEAGLKMQYKNTPSPIKTKKDDDWI